MVNGEDKAVLVVGSYAQDLVWNSKTFPAPGETLVGKFRTGPGGKGSNQAVAAARVSNGTKVMFCGCVGDDLFGTGARDFQAKQGIDVRVKVHPTIPTGTAGILVNDEGQNSIVVALGSNLELKSEDVSDDMLQSAGIIVMQHEIDPAVNEAVLSRARALGVTTVLNPAPMAPISETTLASVDILAPNETEFATMLQQRGIEVNVDLSKDPIEQVTTAIAEASAALPVRTVVVTLGSRGVCVYDKEAMDTPIFIPAFHVHCVDSTGAGDAFIGGFATKFVENGGDVVDAAKFGNATAALSVTKEGTAPAMPTRGEVEDMLQD
ncbi:Ribokinase [Carpediemonas membranifera]|uniref:Ribokinase n=1 Tax=Carpediemonas membranifera TaxID=201153 RepID=A0A8J6AZS9_9EUKA|nr:Ribokinase [Carpediemonas membranifera]|eukprot:KAG9396260.1 Ribokinase [Carpediemonas membranifera]